MTEFSMAVELMREQGGTLRRLDGEEVVAFAVPPFRVHIFQTYRDLGQGEVRVALELVADLPEFSAVANKLIGNPPDSWRTIHKDRWSQRLAEYRVTRDLVREQITRLLDGVKALDPGQIVARCRDECPDFQGGAQLSHIAAVALAGDAARLQGYLDRMTAGDRLNFVPMITPEVVQRALALAAGKGD